MQVVDSQVHIWAADTPECPWPARHAPHKPEPITKDVLLGEMAIAGIDRAVLVPPHLKANAMILSSRRHRRIRIVSE